MVDNKYWNQRIRDTIERCAYEFYIIHPISQVKCTCLNHSTNQADPKCKMCLGMGTKIKIRKIRGAANDVEASVAGKGVRGSSSVAVGKTYFIDSKYPIGDTDVIIDDDEVLYVFRVYTMKGLEGTITHNQVSALPMRNDHKVVLKNFRELLKLYGGNKHVRNK